MPPIIAPSRALLKALRQGESPICCQCRGMSTTAALRSGHSRWSKIKHDKAKMDASINKKNSVFSHAITTASKFFGPDPAFNPRLVTEIDKAKRSGFPKHLIEAAIARGQGKSATGASLEAVTIEAILPSNVAAVIDFETDSRLRTLQEARLIVKKAGGNVSPTGYLFERKGRIVFLPSAEDGKGADVDEVLEAALGYDALDVIEGDEGRVIVFTAPADTKGTAESLSRDLGLDIETSDIIYDPIEDTMAEVNKEADLEVLKDFAEKITEESGFQGLYINAKPGPSVEPRWQELVDRLDA